MRESFWLIKAILQWERRVVMELVGSVVIYFGVLSTGLVVILCYTVLYQYNEELYELSIAWL